MLSSAPAERFHRIVIVGSLVLAPLLLAVSILVHPGQAEGGLIDTLAGNPGRVEAANLLVIVSSLVFIPGLLGLLRYVPARGKVLTHIGVGLAVIGVVGHAIWAGFQLVLLGLVQSDFDLAQLSTLVEGDPPNVAFIVVMLMFLAGFFLGFVLMAGGLWRSQTFPKWAAVGIGLLPLFDFLPINHHALYLGGPVIAAIAFGAVGWTIFRSHDREEAPDGVTQGSAAGIDARPQVS